MKNKLILSTLTIALSAALAACGGSDSTEQSQNDGQDNNPPPPELIACTDLNGMEIPSTDIGLPTTGAVIQSAALVAAGDGNVDDGDICSVTGIIRPVDPQGFNIEFQVNLPQGEGRWNGKAVQYGGGGFDGSLVSGRGVAPAMPHPTQTSSGVETPLMQGFMTMGDDGGHKNADGSAWFLNDEAQRNYGGQHIKKTHDAAAAVAKAHYGAAPTRYYFVGTSQGGHEALDAAARFPNDYDGVVATYPAYNVPMLHLASWNVGVASGTATVPNIMNLETFTGTGANRVSNNDGTGNKQTLVNNWVQSKCDEQDGLKDNIASNLPACRLTATMVALRQSVADGGLRCEGGVDTDPVGTAAADATCLSDAQLDAVEKISTDYSPGFAIAGALSFPGWGILEGAKTLPLGTGGQLFSFGGQTMSYTFAELSTQLSVAELLAFDTLQYKDRIQYAGTILDVTNVNLEPFRAKGGKIIMTHGTEDQLITERNSEQYYERQLEQFGQATLDTFMKFYVIPGLAHSGGGTFSSRYDALTKVVDWAENGVAPDSSFFTVDQGNGDNLGRTRPMCLYGTYPRYNGGNADPLVASSFTCVSTDEYASGTAAAD